MKFLLLVAALLLVAPSVSEAAAPKKKAPAKHAATHSTAKHTAGKRGASSKRGAKSKAHGRAVFHAPAGIDSARATEIQTALIKQGYLTGEPSGRWDPQSISAMQKLQSDSGWQSKVVPDSRALIKLGLGPQPLPATAPTGTTPK